MRIIYKVNVCSTLMLPPSAEILDIGVQKGEIVLWYSFEDYEEHSVLHEFHIIGTGYRVPFQEGAYWSHMKTVIDGAYVWHIYKK